MNLLRRAVFATLLLLTAFLMPACVQAQREIAATGVNLDAADPGCNGLTYTILRLLAPPDPPEVAEFLRSPPGQFLDAALKGDLKTVDAQLKAGVDILSKDRRPQYEGNHALQHAARTNNVKLAALLLAKGMDVNTPGWAGYSSLHVAAGLGKLRMVQFLLEHGANIHQLGENGTPLEIAVIQGRALTVDLLIKRGALKNLPAQHEDPMRLLAYVETVCPSHVQVLLTLKRAGLPMENGKGELPTYLRLAMNSREFAIALQGKEFGIDWAAPTLYKRTLDRDEIGAPAIVHLACGPAGTQVAQDLFRTSPEREALKKLAVGAWGTPLHCAYGKGEASLTRQLLDIGFDPNARDSRGRTALHMAPKAGTVDVLAKAGADVNARDGEGKTPLFYATETEAATMLVARGANVNARDAEGNTPLHRAVAKWRSEVATALVKAGADVTAKNNTGQRPVDLAARNDRGLRKLLGGEE